ncbi:hypothetical protein PG993_014439 [Apiospora rasikravindrae]|uniref:P-loop containing nucleoside triphosphate hydrolase n=1 Tax=Apiospora rasikravindrae TaxID=990691 RepID=A0ABR1RP53_9PEZI
MSSPDESATEATKDSGGLAVDEQVKSITWLPDSVPENKPKEFTVFFSGNSDPTKAVTIPQFKFIPNTVSTPNRTASFDSGSCSPSSALITHQAAKESTTSISSGGIQAPVTPRPLFGPLSVSNEPQGERVNSTLASQRRKQTTSPAPSTNAMRPMFGPLSLNIKPQEKGDNFSAASQNSNKAIIKASQRPVPALLPLRPTASQALSQAYRENYNIVDLSLESEESDSMEQQQLKKSRKASELSNTAAASSKPPLTKRSEVTAHPSHHPRATAATKSGPPNKTIKSAPRTTGTSEEKRNAHHSTSTSDELEDSGDESEISSGGPDETDSHRDYHLKLLARRPEEDGMMGIMSAPIFTYPVLEHARSLRQGSKSPLFPQYAFLAGNSQEGHGAGQADPRIFYNVASPSSIFICGQQGSGKSHTLSCLLEGCLMPSKLGRLPHPLTGIVFHYDTFVSDASGTPCEAAYLASSANIKVRVLCAPTSIRTMKKTYSKLPGVSVEELRLRESDLNTKRMLDLMQVGGGSMPLYMHVIQRLLRDMRLEQQKNGTDFNYFRFRNSLAQEDLTQQQSIPLQQRLDTLESFMVRNQVKSRDTPSKSMKGTFWTPCEGQLTIVDLSCPCVTAEMACSLFNICLSLFLEQPSSIGRVVALDEAHKYMSESAEAQTLTNSLLSTIRLQRHLGARVFISTQEPTISPKLLDLCSITIVHHFQSPDWLRVLKGHLAGVSSAIKQSQGNNRLQCSTTNGTDDNGDENGLSYDGVRGIHISQDDPRHDMMSHIVKLRTGDAFLFAPSAIVGLEKQKAKGAAVAADGSAMVVTPKQLHHEVMRVRVRARITADGGKSILAT